MPTNTPRPSLNALRAFEATTRASGFAGDALKISNRYEHFYLLIQAALCSLGVAMVCVRTRSI